MPDAPGLELLLAEINRNHPGAVVDTSFDREQPALLVDPAFIVDVLSWLRDTPGQEYTFLASVHGVDYFPRTPRFAVHYELINRERYERLRVKAIVPEPDPGAASVGDSPGRRRSASAGAPGEPPTDATQTTAAGAPGDTSASRTEAVGVATEDLEQVKSEEAAPAGDPGGTPDGAERRRPPGSPAGGAPTQATVEYEGETLPVVPSCVELFPTADFQEREVFDFFGIHFEGHPDLRRILMPEDYVGWPQRRDFPVGGEPVLFTKDEVDNPGWWR